MEFNPKVSLFKNAKAVTTFVEPSVITLLDFIKNGTYKSQVEAIRSVTDKKERGNLKKQLPGVTWSATFSKRDSDLQYVTAFSQLICHDIDEIESEQLLILKDKLCLDRYVFACFISPSGNGLKILFKVGIDVADFLSTWIAIGAYIEVQLSDYGIVVDQKCKDISRLCFVSYDPDLFHNEASTVISPEFVEKWTPKVINEPTPKGMPIPQQASWLKKDTAAKFNACHESVIKTVLPQEGTFNAYINQFAIQANRWGLDETDTAQGVAFFCNWPSADKNDTATIKSVFRKFAHEKGKYLNLSHAQYTPENSPNTVGNQPEKPKEKQPSAPKEASRYNTTVKFWYLVAKQDKDGNRIHNEGEEVGEYKYSYDDAITFLQNNGFYKYRVGAGYQFIQVDKQNKQVEIVDELRIKEFMIDFLKSNASNEFKRVREMFRRGAKNYCSTGILEGMEYYAPILNRDTPTNAYIYFNNCFLDISKEGIQQKQYSEQQGYIWKRQMLDFDYMETNFDDSDTNLFLWYASTGRKIALSDRTPEEFQKYESLRSTIGYTLHRYKSPALTKAIITTDKKLRSTGENNGRSGKSLVIKLITQMLNVVTIDGRNFSFDKDFNFQKVNVDTALINFDDVKPNFDFSRLFSMITEEFSFEKKRIDLITIPFSDAPKFWISSNSTLKGGGESAIARQQIIEFSGYFNSAHSPAKEFGRMFFHQWDQGEWQKYYCFMVHCVKAYMDNGLLDFPLENYGLNKLIDTAGEEFVDYMDDTIMTEITGGHKKEWDAKVLFESYLSKITAKYPPKKNTFSKWVKMWAELHDLKINEHKEDGRDRRNGTDYLIFTTNAPLTQVDSDEKLPF